MNPSPVFKHCNVGEDKKKVDGSSSSSSVPFLLVGRGPYEVENQSQTRSLYNLVTQKICDFEVQLSHDYYCRGSSFGWLVAMKPDFRDDYYYQFHVQLYNPFLTSKNIINLPPLFNILEIKQMDFSDSGIFENIYDRDLSYLLKAVLSCNPMLNNNFAVMAILGSASKLAFYTPALKDWTPINWERKDLSFFTDVIYSNKTQQFYAVKSSGEVFAIDLIPDQDQDHVILPKLTQVTPSIPEICPSHKYIVETSSGDLLQVLKTGRGSGSDWDGDLTRTFDFIVLKFDPLAVTWSRIYDMGDTILFLGDNSSLSRSASDFPGCKPNCIYYTDDVHVAPHAGMKYLPHDMAIYNLADGSHQPHYPTTSANLFPSPIWLEPTLQR